MSMSSKSNSPRNTILDIHFIELNNTSSETYELK